MNKSAKALIELSAFDLRCKADAFARLFGYDNAQVQDLLRIAKNLEQAMEHLKEADKRKKKNSA